MITKCWSGKKMKGPFWKQKRKYEGDITTDLQKTARARVCACVRVRERERDSETELESSDSRFGTVAGFV
jgi:hypothetical protein